MSERRAFYITQESLAVFEGPAATTDDALVFADTDEGLQQFDEYLAAAANQASLLVVDVIEEEFVQEQIPKLGRRDRSALIARRLQRKFPRTPYRLATCLGSHSRSGEDAAIVHSAISNHELLDHWLQVMLKHEVPLLGVYSVPLMAASLLQRFYKTGSTALLVTQHQGQRLRQVFLKQGHVLSARLSQSPGIDDPDYAEFVVTEIQRSRRYLERTRTLSSIEQLDVYIVADASLAESLHELARSNSPMQLHFIDPQKAASRLGVPGQLYPDRMEALYLHSALRRRPQKSYAVSGESRFFHMRRIRHGIIGTAIATAAACSIAAALYLSDTWTLNRQSSRIENQLALLTETFRRENERFDPIRADSHEMKLAVDTGDYILKHRLPVPWVMQQLGLVMGNYPDVQIRSLRWSAEIPVSSEPARRQRAGESLPVPIDPIAAVSADIAAEFPAFDGNMRQAFQRIDQLIADIQATTAFSEITVVEYPLNANPAAALSGEIVGEAQPEAASFRLRLRLAVAPAAAASEANDESV